MNAPVYTALKEGLKELDARETSYRFNLLEDIDWNRLTEPGVHFSQPSINTSGISLQNLESSAQASELFQWSAALEFCNAYQALYSECLDFIDTHASTLGPRRSMLLLYQEKRKHQNLLKLYTDYLRSIQPSRLTAFDKHYSLHCPPRMLRFQAVNDVVAHFQSLARILLITQFAIHLSKQLHAGSFGIQPVWGQIHKAHQAELEQHHLTLVGHLNCIELSDESRKEQAHLAEQWALTFIEHLLPLKATCAFLEESFPESSATLLEQSTNPQSRYTALIDEPEFGVWRTLHTGDRLENIALKAVPAPDNISILQGAAYQRPPSPNETLVDRLIATMTDGTDKGLVYLRSDGSEKQESYAELFQRAKHVLDYYRQEGANKNDAIMLQINQPEDFVALFWGALLGGMIPVPLSGLMTAGSGGTKLEKTYGIHDMLDQPLIVTDAKTKIALEKTITEADQPPLRMVTTEDAGQHRASLDVKLSPSDPNETAFIQFSSGSTGTPKGVCLTHQNLLHNIISIIEHQDGKPEDCFVSWLPLFHDMGIIGYQLLPVVLQAKQVLMLPLQFMKRPMTWLKALDRHQGTCTASPNFGLTRVLAKVTPEEASSLNLKHIHSLLNGSEPISWEVLQRFTRLLEPSGFAPTAMSPGYGLAEGSLCISARPAHTLPRVHHINRNTLNQKIPVITSMEATSNSIPLVEVGTALAGVSIRIMSADDNQIIPGTVGHIQIRGPNVTHGYYKAPELNATSFCDGWLRTGDLGFILDGRLVITGRHKDILFVRGQNFYAHDIEQTLHELDWFELGRVAIFASTHVQDGCDLICLAGVFKKTDTPLAQQFNQTRKLVAEVFGIQIDNIIPVRSNDIAKTSSGKIQRHILKDRFEAGDFQDVVDVLPVSLGATPAAAPPKQTKPPQGPERSRLQNLIRQVWIEILKVSAERVTLTESFTTLGGTSLQAAEIHATLEDKLGDYISHEFLAESDTVEAMANYIETHYPELVEKLNQET